MNHVLGFVWIIVLLLGYVLFEKLCQYGFSKTAAEVMLLWWKNGSGKWIVVISGIFLIAQAFIAQDIVTKTYALCFGKAEQRVLIGRV
ncbi:MAG: hypothetical protein KDD04_06075, partial [Sinomicrobium sp.]|nr:hypothetical protein [Sinomicrobium sp.]